MATYTQTKRPLSIATPLGADALLLVGFSGTEAISQLFHFKLDLLAEKETAIAFDRILGQKVTVTLVLPANQKRYFHGIVSSFSQGHEVPGAQTGGPTFIEYSAEVVPQFWLLTRKVQSRIFQQMSVPDILKKVLTGLDVSYEIQGTFQKRDYCVQYRESDFNFASRLMEEEGIYYYFKHTASGHQMVLGNAPQGHADVPGPTKIIFEEVKGGTRAEDRVTGWVKTQEVRSGKYTLWDHCFELPHKNLAAEKTVPDTVQTGTVSHKLKVGSNDQLEVYDYPGHYAQRFDGIDPGGGNRAGDLQNIFQDNARTVGIRMQQETVPGLVILGEGGCAHFVAGHKFTLDKHFNANGAYVLTEVEHTATMTGAYVTSREEPYAYGNKFRCIPAALPFRPVLRTPKPAIKGTQTAVVVGPSGQEIFTDKYSRVKVQFFWDREGKFDQNSSCWIRVATVWAGKRWGVIHIPRIGQEVVVDFLEGDPDQPIVIGSVYNSDQMPAYLGDGLDSKHKNDPKLSGIKTNTTLGGAGFNELRFDDTKDKQQVFMHAERNIDTRVKNDCMELVLNNRHLVVGRDEQGKKGNQYEMVYVDKHLKVHKNHVEQIGGNMELLVGGIDGDGNQDIIIKKDKKELIEGDHHLHIKGNSKQLVDKKCDLTVKGDLKELVEGASHHHVKGDRNEKADGNQSLTVGSNQNEKVGQNHALEAGMAIHIKAGTTLVIEAGVQLSLKAGGNFIDIGPTGVAIQGTMVMINSGGAAGSGSGSSPTAPQDAEAPTDAKKAEPTAPVLADDSKSGSKSAPG